MLLLEVHVLLLDFDCDILICCLIKMDKRIVLHTKKLNRNVSLGRLFLLLFLVSLAWLPVVCENVHLF